MPFQDYSPEQAALLPLHVRDVLSEKHLVFLISAVVERQDLSTWEAAYSEEGQRPYHPALLLKVLLYAFALGVRGSRKIEQRVKEDLGFRYLAGGAEPDHKTICEFLRRHGRRVNDLFTAVLEQLQAAGLGKLGVVALDSTRVKANASRERVMTETGLRAERHRKRRQVRQWQRELAALEGDENPGGLVAELERVQQRLAEIPVELQQLRRRGQSRLSRTDADSRFLHSREGFVLGYTAEAAVGEDGMIVAARVTQAASDHASLPAESAGRCGLLLQPECGSDGRTWGGVICSRLGAGARTETGPAGTWSDAHLACGTETDAAAVAITGWAKTI
jgi:transposase